MSNRNLSYGTASQGITCTLASLATAGARECTAIVNTSNLFLDAIVYLAVAIQTGTPASDKRVNVWFYGSEDGNNYGDNATGTDAAVTMRSPSNLMGPFVINVPSGATTYKAIISSVAEFFGGVLPPKWGIVVENRTNLTFSATESDHTKEYRGVLETIV
jgi:hypothetical protein